LVSFTSVATDRPHVTSVRSGRQWGPGPVLVGLAVIVLVVPASIPAPASAAATDGATRVTVYRASDTGGSDTETSDTTFENAGAVEAAIERGRIEPAERVILGDTLVAVVESERLTATMAAGSGSTTDRFFDALEGDATFRVVQTNPTPMVNRKAAWLGPENVTVYRDGTTTYALVRTGSLAFRYRRVLRPAEIDGGERFAVEFGYDLGGGPDEDDPAGPVVEFFPVRSEFDPNAPSDPPPPGSVDLAALPPGPAELPVRVFVPPEESLAVRVRLDEGRTIRAPVEPAEGGVGWVSRPDLRNVSPGTDYALELVHDGVVVDRYDGTVREPRATVETRVRIALRTERGERIRAPPDDYGVLLRASDRRPAGRVVYRGAVAEAGAGVDGTCRLPTTASGSTDGAEASTATTGTRPPTATLATAGTSPSAPATASGRDEGAGSVSQQDDEARTGARGLAGFTAVAVVGALLVVALRLRGR